MADYSEEIQDAIEMIEEFGGPFSFIRNQPTAPDTDKPWRKTAGVPDQFDATAVMLEFKKTQQSQGFTAGSEDTKFVMTGDMIVYLAAGDSSVLFKPQPRDIVIAPNGQGRYGVVDTFALAPNGQNILYKLWVRK